MILRIARAFYGTSAHREIKLAGNQKKRIAHRFKVETATRLIVNETSLGGTTTTMESRHRWEGDRVPRGLLRLSVGLEDVGELWADLEQALAGGK